MADNEDDLVDYDEEEVRVIVMELLDCEMGAIWRRTLHC